MQFTYAYKYREVSWAALAWLAKDRLFKTIGSGRRV